MSGILTRSTAQSPDLHSHEQGVDCLAAQLEKGPLSEVILHTFSFFKHMGDKKMYEMLLFIVLINFHYHNAN